MEEYNSIEDFIFKNKRYPNSSESRQLYDLLWRKYIKNLNDKEKAIAIENDKMQDYEKSEGHDHAELIKKIAESTGRFKELQKNKKMVISVYYGERWGIYSIYVVVNCLSRNNLYKFRDNIPNFFEGWEIKLTPASFLEKILNL